MKLYSDGKLHRDDGSITCAAIVSHDESKLRWAMSAAVWCNKPATRATVQNSKEPVSWANVGHWYCDEHAPAEAVEIVFDGEKVNS